MIQVYGSSVVLASSVSTSPNAPLVLATSPYSFSSLTQAYGCGRFGGKPAIINLQYYSGSSIITIFGVTESIPSGASGYFSVTGFID